MRLGGKFETGVNTGAVAASAAIPLMTTAATAAWAVPIVGAAAAGVLIAWAQFKKRGAQKEASTDVANDVEKFLRDNRDAYLAGSRTDESQAYALAMFDDAWNFLASPAGCGNPDLGAAGRRCISERQQGASAPWCGTGTGCDWFTLYRAPIEQDTTSDDDVIAGAAGMLSEVFTPKGNSSLLIPAALVAIALAL